MDNKVKFGLKNLYIAAITEGQSGITFGTPRRWPGLVSLQMEPQGESSAFYADDTKYYVATSNDGYEVTVETALVPDWFKKDFLGQTEDTTGNLVEKSTDLPKYFAAMFEFTGDQKATRHCLFYCQAERPTEEGETKGESAEVKTEEIKFTAMALPGTDIIKSKTTDSTTQAAYDAWYEAVNIPVFHELTVSPNPATYESGSNVVLTVAGGTVTSIKEGDTTVTASNYTVSGETVTLKEAYLSGLSEGTHTLTLFAGEKDGTVDVVILEEETNGEED